MYVSLVFGKRKVYEQQHWQRISSEKATNQTNINEYHLLGLAVLNSLLCVFRFYFIPLVNGLGVARAWPKGIFKLFIIHLLLLCALSRAACTLVSVCIIFAPISFFSVENFSISPSFVLFGAFGRMFLFVCVCVVKHSVYSLTTLNCAWNVSHSIRRFHFHPAAHHPCTQSI